jgi:hypothetical protein
MVVSIFTLIALANLLEWMLNDEMYIAKTKTMYHMKLYTIYLLQGQIYKSIKTSSTPIPLFNICSIAANNIHLPQQHRHANNHGDSNDGQINANKVATADVNKLLTEDVAPQQSSQRGAKCDAERAVIDADDHGVDRTPEVTV